MLPDDLRAALREEVYRLRRAERRWWFPPAVHVGRPGHEPARFDVRAGDAIDAGLARDAAAALLSRALVTTDAPAAWLTRPGVPEPHDLDAVWAPALAEAFDAAGRRPGFVAVVTKNGWYEPHGSDRAEWKRLRIRAPRPRRG